MARSRNPAIVFLRRQVEQFARLIGVVGVAQHVDGDTLHAVLVGRPSHGTFAQRSQTTPGHRTILDEPAKFFDFVPTTD